MNFQYPSLILDHARETYDSVLCNGKTMSMTFHSQHYYEHVKEEWAQHHEMVVITIFIGIRNSWDTCRSDLRVVEMRSGEFVWVGLQFEQALKMDLFSCPS